MLGRWYKELLIVLKLPKQQSLILQIYKAASFLSEMTPLNLQLQTEIP